MWSRDSFTAISWKCPDLHGVDQAEDPAHALAGVLVGDLAVGEQLDLLELLLEGHLGQEPLDPPLDPAVGPLPHRLQRGLVTGLRRRHHPAGHHQADRPG
jgi:hypothetical protein